MMNLFKQQINKYIWIIDVILKSAATEKVGDGKIFITPVEVF